MRLVKSSKRFVIEKITRAISNCNLPTDLHGVFNWFTANAILDISFHIKKFSEYF